MILALIGAYVFGVPGAFGGYLLGIIAGPLIFKGSSSCDTPPEDRDV